MYHLLNTDAVEYVASTQSVIGEISSCGASLAALTQSWSNLISSVMLSKLYPGIFSCFVFGVVLLVLFLGPSLFVFSGIILLVALDSVGLYTSW